MAVWRLDRLGRTAVGLHELCERLRGLGVNLVSIRDGLDLGTPSGRVVSGVLASLVAWEREARSGRAAAGLAAKKKRVAAGKDEWNVGRPRGTSRLRGPILAKIKRSIEEHGMAETARAFGVSRQAIYKALAREKDVEQ